MESFTSAIQTLIKTNKDFPQELKQRLVLESHNVKNPFKFMAGLITEGVLSDESSGTEASVGLKEMMVQLAMMTVCLRGADGIRGLTKALAESGNLELISSLRTWIKENFAMETEGDRSEPERAGAGPSGTPKNSLTRPVKTSTELESNAAVLTEEMGSRTEDGSFEELFQKTQKWFETSEARKTKYPVFTKGLPNQLKHKAAVGISRFFEQAPPSNDLKKVASLSCSPHSFVKGKSSLKLNKEMMTAAFEGTLKLWNWRENGEATVNFQSFHKVKGLTAFQFDEDVLFLGTSTGTVYLFDPKSLEEKWSIRLGEPVVSLHIFESTLVVVTRHDHGDKLWWAEISRSDMRLLNRRPVATLHKNTSSGFLIDYCSFVHYDDVVFIRDTKSGQILITQSGPVWNADCSLQAPAVIKTLSLVHYMEAKSFIVAGCRNGFIAIWHAYRDFGSLQKPVHVFQGHQEAIVCLSSINGHLLSVCEGGKLLMWSGHDLASEGGTPAPRVLAENFSNVTCLAACEGWLASGSSEDGVINIWALPDLWLRTG